MGIRSRFKKTYEAGEHPAHSPWGQPQTWIMIAPGIWSVDTASHGGFWLTGERNADMPSYFRNTDAWYEEDLEYAKVVCVYGDDFVHKPDEFRTHAQNTVRNWYPEAYEKHFKVKLSPGESTKRDEKTWRQTVISKYVARTAYGDSFHGVPEGYVVVDATYGDDTKLDEKKLFLVPKADYRDPAKGLSPFGFVFEPGHPYPEVDRDTFDPHNTKKQATNGTTLEEMRTTKTVKIELVVTYEDRGGRDAKHWNWREMLGLDEHESAQVIDVKDY